MNKAESSGGNAPQVQMEPVENQIVVYQPNETVRLDVRLENETVWLTQSQMATLFGCSTDNVGLHLKNIYSCGELDKEATTEESSVVQIGTRRVLQRPGVRCERVCVATASSSSTTMNSTSSGRRSKTAAPSASPSQSSTPPTSAASRRWRFTLPRRTGCQPVPLRLTPEMPCPKAADLCYTVSTQEITMDAAENQIVVYQPNETVRLNVRLGNETERLMQSVCGGWGVEDESWLT